MTAAAVFSAYRSSRRMAAARRGSLAHYPAYAGGFHQEKPKMVFEDRPQAEVNSQEKGEAALKVLMWTLVLLLFLALIVGVLR